MSSIRFYIYTDRQQQHQQHEKIKIKKTNELFVLMIINNNWIIHIHTHTNIQNTSDRPKWNMNDLVVDAWGHTSCWN